MTLILRDKLLERLYDLNDALKVHLIDINASKQLFMNGPSQELLKRAFNISYYQGQKQAIEACQKLITDYQDDKLIHELQNYQRQLTENQTNLTASLHHNDESQYKLAEELDNHYHNLGQSYIVTQVISIIKEAESD